MDLNELRELLTAINQTDIAEFTLKSGDFELVVRKSIHNGEALPSFAASPTLAPAAVSIQPLPSAAPLPQPVVNPPVAPSINNDRCVDVVSPMVGTFYRAPGPEEAPFVNVGDRIQLGQTVCIIEAMKLMNELEAEVAGEIVEILATNGEPVEYGQVLMRVNPS